MKKYRFETKIDQLLTIYNRKEEIESWLDDNQIPYEHDKNSLCNDQYPNALVESWIIFTAQEHVHMINDPGHSHSIEVPVITYDLLDPESAVLFKLTWGDHFIHTVVEDDKEWTTLFKLFNVAVLQTHTFTLKTARAFWLNSWLTSK